MIGTLVYAWYFIGVSEAPMISSGCDDIPTEAETRSQLRRRLAVVRLLVLLADNVPVPLASASRERSRELLEEAFDNGMYHFRWGFFVVFHDCSSFLVVVLSDHFSNDPAVTPINATRHQPVRLGWRICAEERAQTLESLMSSKYCRRTVHGCSLVCVHP